MTASPRVLIVEDEPLSARTLIFMLTSNGYDVVHAPVIDKARTILSGNDDLMLVIMDLAVPLTSGENATSNAGFVLAQEIEESNGNVPIKFITALTEHVNVNLLEALRNFDGFHSKPLSLNDILENARNAFNRWSSKSKGAHND